MAAETIPELELYLVRHAQSRSNAGEKGSDSPLSELGQRQAELLGEFFAQQKLDCIISSGLRRAVATASEVAKRQPEDGAKVVEINRLFCECGTGPDNENRTIAELAGEFPLAVPTAGEDWESEAILYTKPEPDELRKIRADQALAWLRERFRGGEKVMVVAHGAFNTWLFFEALNMPGDDRFDADFSNTGITKFVFYKEGFGRFGCNVNLMCQNDHAHLRAEFPEMLFDMK